MRPVFFHGIFLPWVRRAGKILFLACFGGGDLGRADPHPPELAAL
jgi:hypothetical protein